MYLSLSYSRLDRKTNRLEDFQNYTNHVTYMLVALQIQEIVQPSLSILIENHKNFNSKQNLLFKYLDHNILIFVISLCDCFLFHNACNELFLNFSIFNTIYLKYSIEVIYITLGNLYLKPSAV